MRLLVVGGEMIGGGTRNLALTYRKGSGELRMGFMKDKQQSWGKAVDVSTSLEVLCVRTDCQLNSLQYSHTWHPEDTKGMNDWVHKRTDEENQTVGSRGHSELKGSRFWSQLPWKPGRVGHTSHVANQEPFIKELGPWILNLKLLQS